MNERHHLTFDTYEEGKLTLDEYLKRVVFFEKRSFSEGEFKKFMFEQSRPYPDMMNLVRAFKNTYGHKIVAVSNEGRELNEYRVRQFRLGSIIDSFVSSCFVHYRKPDPDIYRIALDIAQVPAENVLYIDDRLMFIEVARSLGIEGIHHRDHASTREALSQFGFTLP